MLFYAGCAGQLQTLTPSTSFLTSEVQGKFSKITVAAGAIDGASAQASLKEDSEQIKLRAVKSFTHLMLMPQAGLAKRVDAFVKFTTHSPFLYGLKWQIFGDTKTEAVNGSNSFSIYMGGGRHRYQSPSELNFETGGDFEANRTHTIVDYGAIYGKRIYSDILVYARYSNISQESHGKISFPENAQLDGQDFALEGLHSSYALGGVWLTPNINLGLELSLLRTNWFEASNINSKSALLHISKTFR